MKTINQEATKIFVQLLEKLGDREQVNLTVPSCMPLSIALIGKDIYTPFGWANWYSLTNYYILSGDLMRELEMCFLVVDQRAGSDQISKLYIAPQMYQQDALGIYEESVIIEDRQVLQCITKWQFAHCAFANQWLRNIRQQGFLK